MIDSISPKQLNDIKDNIIDLRNIEKYNNNHIPNSINIPAEKIILNPEKYLNKKEKYYLYCQKGITSYNTCKILNKLGYKAINITGGYENWIMNN
jgi:rhodanese-related sulfurtransferase